VLDENKKTLTGKWLERKTKYMPPIKEEKRKEE